eukprot:NODE_47_length_27404_cov_0.284270.p13 type:complete len:113 gc:universal NODE_47_length_27404_cov_0.284270:26494-26156(-)
MTVTLLPKRFQTEPNSKPITPAPITISSLGTFWSSRAPVLVTILDSSTVKPGRTAGSLPVAITIFLAFMVVDSLLFVICSLLLDTKEAEPVNGVTLLPLKSISIPEVNFLTD